MSRRGAFFTCICVLLLAAMALGQKQAVAPVTQQPTTANTAAQGSGWPGTPKAQAGQQGADPKQAVPQLPNAPSVTRLTKHQKFETFVRRTYSPYTFASAAINATWAQAWGDWPTYGGGMQGWGKRFGASTADIETRSFFSSFALPVAFHQDPRYHPSHKDGVVPRAWYAATRILVTRSDDGSRMFNYSEVLGVLFTSSLQNAYYPRRDRGFGDTVQRFTGGLTSDATSNLLREFSPELKRFARRIVPKRAQKIEQKLPEPVRKTIPSVQ